MTAAEITPPPDDGEYEWYHQYDGLSRLVYACSQWIEGGCEGDEFIYEYDGAGNLTRFDKWNADTEQVDTVRYVINGANQIQCIDADASGTCNGSEEPWEYDAFGNLTDDGTTTYTYNAANRLSSITAAGVTTTYSYNGDGDRIAQEVDDGVSPVTTTYILDTATPLTMVLSETTAGETITYWHALDTLAQSDGTTTETFAYDGLGSVRQLVDEAGLVTLAQTFDAYGSGYATSGSASSRLGWTGEQIDANGFVYLRARYYAPGIGRFTQMDPSRQDRNVYQYGLGNPVNRVDPSGLASVGSTIPSTSTFLLNSITSLSTLRLLQTTLSQCDTTSNYVSENLQTNECLGGFCRSTLIDWSQFVHFIIPASSDPNAPEGYTQTIFATYVALDMIFVAAKELSINEIIHKVSGGGGGLLVNMPLADQCLVNTEGGSTIAEYSQGSISLYGGASYTGCFLSHYGIRDLIHEMGHGLDEWMTSFVDAYCVHTTGAPCPHDEYFPMYSETLWAEMNDDWETIAPGSHHGYPYPSKTKETGQFVSSYARIHPREDFAETFAAAIIGYNLEHPSPFGGSSVQYPYDPAPTKTRRILDILHLRWRGR